MTTPITGIPTTRVSDLFIRERLLNQVQFDQAALFRIQMQLSTGKRFQSPSDDPIAAMRVISLQRLLQRKDQMKANLTTSQSYLSVTDSALSSVSDLVAEARGATIGVIGTTATDTQRSAAAQQVDQILTQLLNTGNQQFRGRYLFAGSAGAVQPFQLAGTRLVEYTGNEQRMSSLADIDQLFDINLTGNEVFGAISNSVRGSRDLNPVLTADTRLADLRGGQGISRGSIAVTDGNSMSIVDLSQAETVGDLAAMLKAHLPSGRAVEVDINANTLVIRIVPVAGITTNLSIREVGGGTTAAELGILHENGVGSNPIESRDLNPILRLTSALNDILGAHARAAVHSTGADNDFLLEADVPGERTAGGLALNGVSIELVDDPAVTAGNEVVRYDPVAGKIVVAIDAGNTRACQVVDKINQEHDPNLFPFLARLDPLDQQNGGNGLVTAGATATTRDGAGEQFDQNAGLQIVNQNKTFTISLRSAQTVEDVLNIINGSRAGLLAQINEDRTGIDVRSRISGCDFAIGENGGRTAAQLGLRTFTRDTLLQDLNFGRGVDDYAGGDDFFITRTDGLKLAFDISGQQTIGDVIDLINNHPDNAGNTLVAQLAAYGNGIELVDKTLGTGQLSVTKAPLSNAAIDLGLIPAGAAASGPASPGSAATATVASTAPKSGLIFTAKEAGTQYNGVRVIFDPAQPPGSVAYSVINHALTFGINAGVTTAAEIKQALEGSPHGSLFAAEFDPADTSHNDGSGQVSPSTDNIMTVGTDNRSTVSVAFPDPDNDLVFRALASFPAEDGAQVRFVAGPAGPVVIDHSGNTLTITYDSVNGTTAQQIVDAFAGNPDFAVTLDPRDASPNNGSGTVDPTAGPGVTLSGGSQTLSGSDVHPLETEGLFTALLRIRDGLQTNNLYEVQRSVELLDREVEDMRFARSELNARQQGLDVLQNRQDSENIELQKVLSLEYDVDLVAAISEFAGRQAAFEASLRATAQIVQLSLLDYL